MINEISEALGAIDKATDKINALCDGRERWVMHIPVDEDNDPDVVISDALHRARKILSAITQPARVGSSLDEFLKEEGLYDECADKAKEPQPEARAHCPECQNPPTGCAGVCPEPATEPETDGDARGLAERILKMADELQDEWDGGDHADAFDKVTEHYIDHIATLIKAHDATILASHGQGERALREALEQAAQSLEAIGRLAGKDEALLENDQVRGYAINRAAAVRAALGQSAGEES